jgi:hypothetical protein
VFGRNAGQLHSPTLPATTPQSPRAITAFGARSTVLQSIDLEFISQHISTHLQSAKRVTNQAGRDSSGFLPERSDENAYRERLSLNDGRQSVLPSTLATAQQALGDLRSFAARAPGSIYLDRQTNCASANSEKALSRPRAIGVAVTRPGSQLPDHARERIDSIAAVESTVAHRQQTSRRCVLSFSATTSETWRHRANL